MDLTHEQDSSPGSQDVDDVVADHLGEGLNTTFLPQPLVAGLLIVLQLQVVGAVRGLWGSAGEKILIAAFYLLEGLRGFFTVLSCF